MVAGRGALGVWLEAGAEASAGGAAVAIGGAPVATGAVRCALQPTPATTTNATPLQ
jgi:hypothetical protein